MTSHQPQSGSGQAACLAATEQAAAADSNRRLPRSFWLLLGGTFIARLNFFVLPFFTYYLIHARGLSTHQAAVMVSAFGLGWICSQPLGGSLADRIGRRRTIAAGLAATGVSYIALGCVRSMVWIGLCAVLAGLCFDIAKPAANAFIADVVPESRRARAFGLFYWVINIGTAAAGVLGGFFAAHDFQLLFYVDSAACLLCAAAALRLPETPLSRPGQQEKPLRYRQVLADPVLLGFSAISVVFLAVNLQSIFALPMAMNSDGAGPVAYGMVKAIDAIMIIALQPLTQRWLERFPPLKVCTVSCVILGLGMATTHFAASPATYAASIAAWVPGEIAFAVSAPAILAAISPPEARGRYNGIWGMTFGTAAVLAPLLSSWALSLGGAPLLWGGCLAAGLTAAVGCLALAPALKQRAPHTVTSPQTTHTPGRQRNSPALE